MTDSRLRAPRALFDGSLTGGVYRLVAPVGDVVESLTALGWRCGAMSHGDTREDFLTGVGVALGFPSYYGHNLDALWECLCDLDVPTALVWSSWHELAIEHPQDWAQLLTLLEERAELDPPFALILG